MAWMLEATVRGARAYAVWDDTVLEAEPESWQYAARRLLRGELFATPTSAPATEPSERAAIAAAQAAAEVWGLEWQTAPKRWSGDAPGDSGPLLPPGVEA